MHESSEWLWYVVILKLPKSNIKTNAFITARISQKRRRNYSLFQRPVS